MSRLHRPTAGIAPLSTDRPRRVNGSPTSPRRPRQADLSWAPGTPLYAMGALAQLQLGPDALNLAGARGGSSRIFRALSVYRRAMAAGLAGEYGS